MEKKKKTTNGDLRIISRAYSKCLDIEGQIKMLRRVQAKKIKTIDTVMSRLEKNVQEEAGKNEEISKLLQEGKNLIATLRTLLRQ